MLLPVKKMPLQVSLDGLLSTNFDNIWFLYIFLSNKGDEKNYFRLNWKLILCWFKKYIVKRIFPWINENIASSGLQKITSDIFISRSYICHKTLCGRHYVFIMYQNEDIFNVLQITAFKGQ